MKNLHRAGEDYTEAILIFQKKNGSVRSIDVADCLKVTRPIISRESSEKIKALWIKPTISD